MLLFFTFTKKFMRKIFLFLLLSTFFVSCNSTDYTINISADLENDKEVFLIAIDENNQPKTVDTLRILDGIATYSSKIEYPEMHYLLLNGNRDVIPIIIESGNINVQIYKDSIRSSKANGTKSNKEFKKLRAQFKNPDTGQMNTIHFGHTNYQQYKDKTGIWKHKDHGDPVRRKLYRERHAKDLETDEPVTAGKLAMAILW